MWGVLADTSFWGKGKEMDETISKTRKWDSSLGPQHSN
jgi:hypothetical protein